MTTRPCSQRTAPGLRGRPAQQRVYDVLCIPRTTGELATTLGISRQGVARVACALKQRGLIVRYETLLTKPRYLWVRAETCASTVRATPSITADERAILDLLTRNQSYKMSTVRNMLNFGTSFGVRISRLTRKGLIETYRTPWGVCLRLTTFAAQLARHDAGKVKAPPFRLNDELSPEVKALIIALSALAPCRSLVLSLATDIRPSKGYTGRSMPQYLQHLKRVGIVTQLPGAGHHTYCLTPAGEATAAALILDEPMFDAETYRQRVAEAVEEYRPAQRAIVADTSPY